MPVSCIQAGGLAPLGLDVLLGTGAFLRGACPRSEAGQAPPQTAEPVPRFHAPVSRGVLAVSSRTVMSNVG